MNSMLKLSQHCPLEYFCEIPLWLSARSWVIKFKIQNVFISLHEGGGGEEK